MESLRTSLTVSRGAPQCRHLIVVEGGAFSAQSKATTSASQFMQTILNSGLGTGARSFCDAFYARHSIILLKAKPPNGM